MREKFTPGPWRAELGTSIHTGTWVITSPTMPASSPLLRLNDFDDAAKHDAHLIAAAPDLFAALNSLLKTVIDDLGECGYDEYDIADHDGVKKATAALAKARGEAT